jgi:protocatechuate 3,4-dioxygenase beta subunit
VFEGRDGANGIQDENYLRGVQVSDGSRILTFQTIFPGCYPERYPHIHFEIYPILAMATLYTNRILTLQLALPRDICSAVYVGRTGTRRAPAISPASRSRATTCSETTAMRR